MGKNSCIFLGHFKPEMRHMTHKSWADFGCYGYVHTGHAAREMFVGTGDITEAQAVILSQAIGRVKEAVNRLSTEHRDLHSSVSKVGKAIDKNFTADFGCISNDSVFSGDKRQLVNEVICQHFFREGLLDIAEEFISETGLELQEESREPFFELNRILAALKARDLGPALQWAEENREKLRAQNSSLEFKLHRLAYINLVKEGPHRVPQAIEYARLHFTPFVYQHEKDLNLFTLDNSNFLRASIRCQPTRANCKM
ncbi:Protein RMD5 A [Portunus trituberculatus]|uniref:Protein RMD5 A n=1 Tax=Portunus trituberculatus TaxID=210409 RepID=A0A5B7DVY3_PORTR|nr:Protein RMD5 A [Portunus trituberculatus]